MATIAFWWKGIVLALTTVVVCNATLCRICENGVGDQRLCQRIANCTNDEVCYTELYIGSDGSKTWYSGCLSTQVCLQNDPSFVIKRDVSVKGSDVANDPVVRIGARLKRLNKPGQNICTACCDGDYCNSDLCNLNMVSSKSHECYKCDNMADPKDCNQLTVCSETQSCYTSNRYAGGTDTVYRMGCEETSMCKAFENNIIYFNNTNTNSRSIDDKRILCLTCCNYNYCNRLEDCKKDQRAPDISSSPTGSTPTNVVSPVITTPPASSKISTATAKVTTHKPLVTTDQTIVTTDQSNQAAMTSGQTAVTSDQTTMTSDQTTVTSDHAMVTSDQTTASHQMTMTSDQTTMTSDHTAMTSDQTTPAASLTSQATAFTSQIMASITTHRTPSVPTVVIPGVKCYICHGALCGFPGFQQLVQCDSKEPYCLNSYIKEPSSANAQISKRCVDYQTCKTKWYEASSDVTKCDDLSVTPGQRKECYFCCVTDECNVTNRPHDDDMFSASNIQN